MIRPFLLLILALLAPLAWAAEYEVVTQFAHDGELPMARLVYVPAAGKFFGTTSAGGDYDRGTVFSVTPEGSRTTLVSFSGISGSAKGDAPDAGLVLGPDGNLYGVTASGGTGNYGTIYRISTAGVLTTLIEFTGQDGIAMGAVPNELVLAADGSFYATTQAGGAFEHGTVFRLNLPPSPSAPSITTLIELKGPIAGGASVPRGSAPVGALVANGSDLYGVTTYGGTADFGLVFRITTAGAWTTLAQFTGTSGSFRGAYPAAGLVLHSDGSFYGTTEFGGTEDLGTVFRVSVTGTFTHMHAFNDLDGSGPAGALVMGANQMLYGTTSAGGTDSFGTIFRINPVSPYELTTLHSFTGQSGLLPGDACRAGLTLGPDGAWYGTTSAGGLGDYGTIFKLTPQLAASNVAILGNTQSWFPGGGIVFAASGEFLVPLTEGGVAGNGGLARVVDGMPSIEATFGAPLGTSANGALIKVGANFYGVTSRGGTSNRGTFYRYTPGSGMTTLASLTTSTGTSPEGPLTVGSDGHLYGVAREGGASNRGALLRFGFNGDVTTLVSFTGTSGAIPGRMPHAPLTVGDDDALYGVTELGGASDRGIIFRLPLDGPLTSLRQFSVLDPGRPRAGLSNAGNGIFLGTASASGLLNTGSIFQITITGVLSVITDLLGGADDPQPNSRMFRALDGTFYGTTYAGGDHGLGSIFVLRPGIGFQTLIHFTGSNGSTPGAGPVGELVFGPDGMLYGATESGGSMDGGLVYRLSAFGPHVATDPAGFALSTPLLRGRMQGGSQASTVQIEYGFSSTLPFPNSAVPTSSINDNGETSLTLPVPNLTVGQTVFYRVVASGPNGTSVGEIQSVTVPTPLAGWKLSELGAGASGDLDDPDLDGLANLTEYALLKNPRIFDAGIPVVSLGGTPGDLHLTLTLDRDPARNDVTISVQASSDIIGPWAAVASSVNGAPFAGSATIIGDGPGAAPRIVQIRDPLPVQGSTKRFLRVLVSH